MSTFQLFGLAHEQFEHLFNLPDDQLRDLSIVRSVATSTSGFPCRVSLQDAAIGEELLLLPYPHQPAASPYRASGPVFVRRGATRAVLPPGVVPSYVSQRLMSLRAYDAADIMIDALVCEGSAVADHLQEVLADAAVAYVHLHNAKRGCYSCLARRPGAKTEA